MSPDPLSPEPIEGFQPSGVGGAVYLPRSALETALQTPSAYLPAMQRLFLENDETAFKVASVNRTQIAPGMLDYEMKATLGDYHALKWIRRRESNVESGLEPSQSSLIITDLKTGKPICIMEDCLPLQYAKTALMTMVPLDLWMKKNQPERVRLGIVGGGKVAENHLVAANLLFGDRIERTLVHSRGESGQTLTDKYSGRFSTEFTDVDTLSRDCNVILSCSSSQSPVLTPFLVQDTSDGPKFVASVGWHDVPMLDMNNVSAMISENTAAYIESTYPWSTIIAAGRAGYTSPAFSLSEFVQAAQTPSLDGVTLFLPHGTALADLVLALALIEA